MSSSAPASLGRRIAACRESLGWKQKQLADEAGLSVTFISELENDKRTPGSDTLLRLADALQTSLDYLVKGQVDAPPPRGPLIVPPELVEIADEEGWSLAEAGDLLKFRQMVVARRSRSGESDPGTRPLSKKDWKELFDWFKQSPL